MHRWKHKSWWERGAINLGVALGIGGLVVVGAGAGMGMQRTVFASDDDPGTGGFVNRRAAVPVFDCPGGAAVDTLHNGDRIFASGVHDELEGWLEIRHPNDPGRGFWIEQRFITPDESVGDLEEAPCVEAEVFYGEPPTTTTSSSTTTTTRPGQEPADDPDDPDEPDDSGQSPQPDQTPTTQPSSGGGGSPGTTTTTKPSGGGSPGTTTTTEAPDTTGPSISNLGRSPTSIYEKYDPAEPCASQHTTTVSASISDPSGVSSATLSWSVADANGKSSKAMPGSGGSYSGTVGHFAQNTAPTNGTLTISITVTATDGEGNSSQASTSVTLYHVNHCVT